ncbi:MAG TPA: hypothetical protein GXX19_11800 [Syntrophomonadaceae bacterium]|nr:hypothetical protein [Syntrophomonadaceae bacterium]
MTTCWKKSLSTDVIARIQSTQDALAGLTGIYICIYDPEGTPCTIPSNQPHLCSQCQVKTPETCKHTISRGIEVARKTAETIYMLCPLGATIAVVPVGSVQEELKSTPPAYLTMGKFFLREEPGDGIHEFDEETKAAGEKAATTFSRVIFDRLVKTVKQVFDLIYFIAATGGLLAPGPLAESTTPNTQKYHGLTKREREVLNMTGTGISNQAIAARLFISDKTVKTHITNILKKLNLKNRTELALYAVQVMRDA